LRGIYEAGTLDGQADYYAGWAGDYDRDMMALGYQGPCLLAAMAARHLPRDAGALLDCGAGTGLLGLVLAILGYDDLTAIDMSPEMLAVAERRQVYRDCRRMTLGQALDFPDESFAGCIAAGVFTSQIVPEDSFRELLRITRPGGYVIFSTRTDGATPRPFQPVCDALEAAGQWHPVERSRIFRPFPFSKEEAHIENEIQVYRRALSR
jgi:SAM-dependent methyltransferase